MAVRSLAVADCPPCCGRGDTAEVVLLKATGDGQMALFKLGRRETRRLGEREGRRIQGPGGMEHVRAAAPSRAPPPDALAVAVATANKGAVVIGVDAGTLCGTPRDVDGLEDARATAAVAATQDGSVLALGSKLGGVVLVDAGSRRVATELRTATTATASTPVAVAIASSKDAARVLACAHASGVTRVYELHDGTSRILRTAVLTPTAPAAIATLPPPPIRPEPADALHVAAAYDDGLVREWPWDTRDECTAPTPVTYGQTADGACEAMCYGCSSEGLVVAGADAAVRVFRFEASGGPETTAPWQARLVAKLVLSAPATALLAVDAACPTDDGWIAVVGTKDGNVVVWCTLGSSDTARPSADVCFAEATAILDHIARERRRCGVGGALAPSARARLWHGAHTDVHSLAAMDAAARIDAWEAAECDAMRLAHAPAPRRLDTGAVCAICLAPQAVGALLPCGHAMHEECITEWMRDGARLGMWRCPECRADAAAAPSAVPPAIGVEIFL